MKLAIASVLLFVSGAATAAALNMPIRGVVDGDTIRSTVKLPCPLCTVSVRVLGIDTPETNHLAKCPAERDRGTEAKNAVIALAQGHTQMTVSDIKWDKWGGRILGSVEINGVDVAAYLIERRLAVPYTGAGPKHDWCK